MMRDLSVREPVFHGSFIASIEGMRALAVLAVLLFHLDFAGVQGGYLGVDLFFVISGFIISRNILSDIDNRKFSLREFYIRRFRRLFPALLATILMTLVFGLVVLPPVELANTARSAVFALLSLANMLFWLESGYFDAAADAKPLLHTWSLSVEEQFYLLWPAILLALASTRRRMLFALVLLILSVVASLAWSDTIPSGVFYLLPFRLHQLMAGALIAILALNLPHSIGNIFTFLGTSAFVISILQLGGDSAPATGALLASCCGIALILGRESTWSQRIYANRMMQWVGQRSYAVYLVHWPIIVLFKFEEGFELDNGSRIALFMLSFCAAIALHELVEKPFRKRGEDVTRLQRMAMPSTLITLLLAIAMALVLWSNQGFPSRIDPRIQKILASVDEEVSERRRAIRFGLCNLHKMHTFAEYDAEKCAAIDPERKNVLIVGDSMAADTYMMLSQAYPEIHFSQATAGACTAVLGVSDIGGRYAACEALNEYRFSELIERNFDLIILASIWKEDRIELLADTVRYLRSKGKNVLAMGPRAHFQGSVPILISKLSTLEGVNGALTRRVITEAEMLQRMRYAIPDLDIVDVSGMQCGQECEVVDGERLLYIDERHFSKWGARQVGENFRVSFDLPSYIDSLAPPKD